MNSNDLQNLSEAYNQIQRLSEAQLTGGSAGFTIRRDGYKGLYANVNTDKGSGQFTVGRQQVGNGPTDPKDSIDAALGELGDAAYGGKPGAPQQAAKPTKRTITTGSVTGEFSDSIGSGTPKPPAPAQPKREPKPDPRNQPKPGTTPPAGTTPDPRRVIPPADGTKIRDERTTNPFGTSETRTVNGVKEFSRFTPTTNVIQRNSYEPEGEFIEQFTYYQVLSYLIDEGYASSEQAADKIILNMSEAWFKNIMERRKS